MTEQKVVDPKREARKVAKKELRAKQKEAMAKLQEVIEKSQDKAVLQAWNSFTSLKAVRSASTGNPNYAKFVAFVAEKKSVSEDEVFKAFKVGRKDCAGFIRKFLKTTEAKDRVWINFTPSDGMYKVIGTGEKAPAGYTGYVPTEETINVGIK